MKTSTKISSILLLCLLMAFLIATSIAKWGSDPNTVVVSGIQPGTPFVILPVSDLPAHGDKMTLSHQVWNGKNWLPAADGTKVVERGTDSTTLVSGIAPGTPFVILPVSDLPAETTLSHQVWNGKNWLPAADGIKP